ncbi:MAG: O-antigen/teichoic acid export membrane protein [Desulforhopalus sp.]|jgi:O-antigen/teichoic acid export membrane protein
MTELRKKILHSAAYVLGGDSLSQGLRLLSNLILTRLLVPELFGLMAISNVLIMAIGLFSDIGLGPGVIRSKRGLEPSFLNTAWTLQVIRGFCLWIMTIVFAHPVALIYDESILSYLVPVIGFGFVISGFNSMAIITQNKKLVMGKIVLMNLSTQLLSIICMTGLAYMYRSVWALVIGGLVASAVKLVWSYRLDKKLHHHFIWDKSAINELFHFGKWIFLSTSMMFLATQADRILLGKLFPLALLGVYSIAAGFAELPKNVVNQISGTIIFPIISMYADLPRHELRNKILQKRKLLLFPLAFLVALFTGFGDILINFLYDSRYQEAGWILPLLSLGMWPLILYATIDRSLYVVDNPIYPALGNSLKFIYMIICLPLAHTLHGKLGAVVVVAFNDIPVYLAINYGLKKKGLSGIKQDIFTTMLLVVFIVIIIFIRLYFDLGFPGYSSYSN